MARTLAFYREEKPMKGLQKLLAALMATLLGWGRLPMPRTPPPFMGVV